MKRAVGRSLGRAVSRFRSPGVREMNPERLRARGVALPDLENLHAFCMFVGYPRSGHSIVGALLDAHQDVLIAHELDSMRYIEEGFTRRELFGLLVDQDRRFVGNGAVWEDYQYLVEGQHQGRVRTLRVIGDKKGGVTTRHLRNDPALLDRVQRFVELPVRFVHVVRNPFDNIATMSRKDTEWIRQIGWTHLSSPMDIAIEFYRENCETNARLQRELGPESFFEVRHESFANDPAPVLAALCRFLGVEPDDRYLTDCSAIVRPPSPTRDQVDWEPAHRARVEGFMEEFDFLHGYAWTA